VPVLPDIWKPIAIGLAVALLALGIFTTFTVIRKNLAVAKLATLTAQVEAAGEQAKLEKQRTEAAYEKRLADEKRRGDSARAALAKWMSGDAAGRSVVPDAPATPSGTDRTGQVCFDRAGFDAAMGRGRGIAAQGAEAVIDRAECVGAWPARMQ